MEKSVNYIVAIYGGERRWYSEETPVEKFINIHFEFLKKRPKFITEVTFVFNRSNNIKENNVIKNCEDFLENNYPTGRVIVRDNKAVSYGAWNEALLNYNIGTTHSFLIEDDYIPSTMDFLDFFLKKDTPNTSFVASYYYNNHAAIANGLINNEKVREAIKTHGRVFQLIDDCSYGNGSYHNQYSFLNLLNGGGSDITDIGYTLFFDGGKKIPYTDETKPKLIEPIIL
jgi:hypothetical protein